MMLIGFDARLLLHDLRGIGVYLFNLLEQLLVQNYENEYILYVNESSAYAISTVASSDIIAQLQKHPRVTVKNLPASNEFLWEQYELPIKIKHDKLDLLHMPANRAPRFCPCKLIVTVHDVIELLFFDQFFYTQKTLRGRFYDWRVAMYMKYMYYHILPKADKIITVSNTSRDDIHTMLGIPLESIAVVLQSFDTKMTPAEKPARDYIFTLGCSAAHKNSTAVLRAYEQLPKDLRNRYKLKIIGCCDKLRRMVSELNDPNIELAPSDFSVSLKERYSNAACFVYASLYEGFGLPVLESMACGTPVIASNQGSVPEIAGNAALFIDPKDIKSITDAMQRVLTDSSLQADLIEKGFKRIQNFSWQSSANKTQAVYESIMDSQLSYSHMNDYNQVPSRKQNAL